MMMEPLNTMNVENTVDIRQSSAGLGSKVIEDCNYCKIFSQLMFAK
jgi:hypothetical protein